MSESAKQGQTETTRDDQITDEALESVAGGTTLGIALPGIVVNTKAPFPGDFEARPTVEKPIPFDPKDTTF